MQGLAATNFLWSGGLLSRKKKLNMRQRSVTFFFPFFRLDVLKAY